MRNLKKFLALVLAMMMAFSLMVTANASTTGTQYTDTDAVDEAFEEAVDVLTGMDIFKGDENGKFNAKANVTRAEMAAIIYRVATGDVEDTRANLYKEYGNFSDVSPDKWYAGYVGYAANAGYIKGRSNGTFDATANVTGYEALAMLLRVVGYDKEDEFTGPTWQVNVSSLATRLGLLADLKNANYDANLQYASVREVIASLVFNTIKPVSEGGPVMVTWTPALHYQTWNISGDMANAYWVGQSVGQYIFGLAVKDDLVVVGNEQTGERTGKTLFGEARTRSSYTQTTTTGSDRVRALDVHGNVIKVNKTNNTQLLYLPVRSDFSGDSAESDYESALGTYNDAIDTGDYEDLYVDTVTTTTATNPVTTTIGQYDYRAATAYGLTTGIDVLGHDMKVWYTVSGGVTTKFGALDVFAYFDNAKTAVVKADDINLGNGGDLRAAIEAAGFKTNGSAVFNNSFGKFGSGDEFATAGIVGNGEADSNPTPIESPVKLYKIINNPGTPNVDAIISLNIETSRVTEANVVRNVATIGVPVGNLTGATNSTNQLQTTYINTNNVKSVLGVDTGVIAQDALVGNSTKTLGDYEMGIHITGTSKRNVSANETAAILGTGAENSYFLFSKVTATVEGKVVAYNANLGTVTLDNGTVLNRSIFYNTVVCTSENATRQEVVDGDDLDGDNIFALPQSIDAQGNESYNFASYKFYTDYEGNYLGAERTYGNDFLYATYVDYTTDLSSSQYIYKVTGVDLNGEVKTIDVSKFWADTTQAFTAPGVYTWTMANPDTGANRTNYVMTGTNNLGVPFRDTIGSNGVMNYIGVGVYKGVTINDGTADPYTSNTTINLNDYSMNMERLGIYRADESGDFESAIYIGNSQLTLGVVETMTNGIDGAGSDSDLFFNEETKFILVDGYGTANIVHEVYDGISALRNAVSGANYVTIDFNDTTRGTAAKATVNFAASGTTNGDVVGGVSGAETATNRIKVDTPWNEMTFFTKSPFTYDQTGDTAEKVNVIILPKDAVHWDTETRSSYYMGNPTATLVSSHEGTPIYQYTVYQGGVAQNVWLTNAPSQTVATATGNTDEVVKNDTFLTLGSEKGKTDAGEPYYTATFDLPAVSDAINAKRISGEVAVVADSTTNPITLGAITGVLNYTATTREAQAGTFTLTSDSSSALLRVVDANVTNLNAKDSPDIGTASGYVWPDIVDVASLNAAGSILPVTGTNVRVAIERDGLIVTQVYVCWDQNQT